MSDRRRDTGFRVVDEFARLEARVFDLIAHSDAPLMGHSQAHSRNWHTQVGGMASSPWCGKENR